MLFEVFIDKLSPIKMLCDKIDKISVNLTAAFSDDAVYNKIYVDSFNDVTDKMIENLAQDMAQYNGNIYANSLGFKAKVEYYAELLHYIIFESDWCLASKRFSFASVEVDNTLWNNFSYSMFQDIDDPDSFDNSRFKFKEKE